MGTSLISVMQVQILTMTATPMTSVVNHVNRDGQNSRNYLELYKTCVVLSKITSFYSVCLLLSIGVYTVSLKTYVFRFNTLNFYQFAYSILTPFGIQT